MQNDCVVEVGSGTTLDATEDLGDVALLPGLVNSHTHLEFSDLAEPIGFPGIRLSDWIGHVVDARAGVTPKSKSMAMDAGIRELLYTGTRLVGEITIAPFSYPQANSELEIVSLAEVLGLDPNRAAQRLEDAISHCEQNPKSGLSPHAPYSTTQQSIDQCIDFAVRANRPVAMHVAESPEERELVSKGTGPFAAALQSMGVWREGVFPWGDQPLSRLINRLASAPRSLLIHGNYLNEQEIQQLSQHPNITVVYCPRTHHFFQHQRHPVDRLRSAGVRVALGTDSRASNPDLNVWHEFQFLCQHRPEIAPRDVLKMVTIDGADAMGRNQMGRIDVGCRPGLGYVRTKSTSVAELFSDLQTNEYVPIPLGEEIRQ